MATTADRGGGRPAKKTLPKSISSSVLHKAEKLKQKLQDSLRHYRKPGFPHTLGHMTLYDIRLPDLSGKLDELVTKLFIDDIMQQDLEEANIINFCKFTAKLYAMKTAGDGNCLLHAVSLAIWGIHDKAMLLRRLLYISLVEDVQTHAFNKRWRRERVRLNSVVPQGMQLSSGQWSSEWDLVVQAAEDCERSAMNPGDLPFESLEEIHIFVLANVIQRPIVVLADSFVRSVSGSLLGPSNFAGIYLPLLWEPEKCSQVPIILGYHIGHFTPLVNMEQTASLDGVAAGEYAVPLVNKNMEPLYIHFLLEEEETVAIDILQRYVNVTELNWKKDGRGLQSSVWLLCAKLEHTKIDAEYDLMTDYIHEIERKAASRKTTGSPKRESKQQTTEKGHERRPRPVEKSTTSVENLVENEQANKKYPGKRSPAKNSSPLKVQGSKPKTRSREKTSPTASPHRQMQVAPRSAKLCVKDGCQYYGSLEYGGLCYGCFMKKTMSYQPTRRQDSRTEFQYIPSISGDNCAHGSCTYMASKQTYPFCHEHAGETLLGPAAAVQIGSGNLYTALYVPSITDTKCSHRNCQNVASNNTFPYCHEHKKDLKMSHVKPSNRRKPVIHSEVEHLEHHRHFAIADHSSMTPYKCKNHDCTNVASSHTFPYCHEHFSHQEAAPTIPAEDQADEPEEDDEQSIRDFLCNQRGCSNPAAVNTFPFCQEHFTQVIPRPVERKRVENDRLSYERNESWNEPEDEPAREDSLTNYKAGSSRQCPASGCACFGPPANDYYCPEHHGQRKSKQDPAECGISMQSTGKNTCQRASCPNQANPKYVGLCPGCYLQEGFAHSTLEQGHLDYKNALKGLFPPLDDPKSFGTTNEPREIERQSSQEAPDVRDLPQTEQMENTPEGELSGPARDPEENYAACFAPNCTNQGRANLKGLCDECYHFLSHKPKKTVSPPQSLLSEDGCEDSTVPTSCVDGNRSPRNSRMHAPNLTEQASYKPHRETKPATAAATTPLRQSPKWSPARDRTTHRTQNGTIQKKRTAETITDRKVNTQEETARWISNLNSNANREDQNDGFVALQRLENNARVSRRKCRSKTCKNFGNLTKNGYCNTCYEQ